MRFLAFFARHPRLRTGLVLIAVAAVLHGGARLWTSGPDAVHITITHVYANNYPHVVKSITYDRTIQDGAVAQQLQRDLAAMPINSPSDRFVCPIGAWPIYDAYTLTWYRAGLPVEQASADDTGCAFWQDDIVFFHTPYGAETLYADIQAAVTAGG
jgi:hypothetical protein